MMNANHLVVRKETSESSGYVIKSVSTRAIGPGGCVVVHIEEEKRLAYVKDHTDFLIPEIPPQVYHVPVFPSPVVKPACAENVPNMDNCTPQNECNSQTKTCKPCESKQNASTEDKPPPAKAAEKPKQKKGNKKGRKRNKSCTSEYSSDYSSYEYSYSESEWESDTDWSCSEKKITSFNLEPEFTNLAEAGASLDSGFAGTLPASLQSDCTYPQTGMDWQSGITSRPHTSMDWEPGSKTAQHMAMDLDSSKSNLVPSSDTEMLDSGSSSCWCEHEGSATNVSLITVDIRVPEQYTPKQN